MTSGSRIATQRKIERSIADHCLRLTDGDLTAVEFPFGDQLRAAAHSLTIGLLPQSTSKQKGVKLVRFVVTYNWIVVL